MTEAATLSTIPTTDTLEALLHFKRPFAPGAVKWKIGDSDYSLRPKKDATWVLVVPYIDARLVAARLNAVVGGGWEEEAVGFQGERIMRYRLKVFGQTHTDVGEGQGRDAGTQAKGADSDAFKRVAVKFGIGAYLYAMPAFNFFVVPDGEVKDDKPTVVRNENGSPGFLKEAHEDWLRNAYEDWLKSDGEDQFGPVLEHGDFAQGSLGSMLDGNGMPGLETLDQNLRPVPLEDDEAHQLLEQIETAYAELVEVSPDRLTEGRKTTMVRDAAHSHAELKRVATTIEHLRDTEGRLAELREQLIEAVGKTKAKPLIDSAERRGSQAERVASLEKAIAEAAEKKGEPAGGE